jgi:hypothetical protein
MTEVEWIACEKPDWMLDYVKGLVSERKLRLFICACCRTHSNSMPLMEEVMNLAEQVADGLAVLEDVERLLDSLPVPRDPGHDLSWLRYRNLCEQDSFFGALKVSHSQFGPDCEWAPVYANRLRCVLGYPFLKYETALAKGLIGPIYLSLPALKLNPSWLTSTVLALANGISEQKAFDRMPILADSLQDAGCDNEEILQHCRGEIVHVRGCWVVDLLLSRE